jgi:hypothetical protein
MIRFLCIAPFLLWLQPAEAKKKKKTVPCWVTSPCDPYNAEEYLVGVGSGESVSSANTAALGSIAQQFTVTVTQQQQSTKESTNTARDQVLLSQTDHQSLRTKTQVDTHTTLQNIQYVEHWTNAQKKQDPIFYSLAVIHRQEWIQQLEGERHTIQSDIQQLRLQSKKKPSSEIQQKINHLRQMIPLIEQDQALYEQQQLIGKHILTAPPSNTIQGLKQEVERYRQQIPILVLPNSDYRTEIQQALTSNGFALVSTMVPVLSIQCSEERIQEPQDSYGFHKIKSSVQCVISTDSGTIHSEQFTTSAASRDLSKAQKQVQQKMQSEISGIASAIQQWFVL